MPLLQIDKFVAEKLGRGEYHLHIEKSLYKVIKIKLIPNKYFPCSFCSILKDFFFL